MTLVRFDRRPFDELYGTFRWTIPDPYNIAVDVCDKWAGDPHRLALIDASGEGETRFTFAEIARLSNRWANALAGLGVGRGARVAVILPQRVEVAVAHLATYKLGAIAVPLTVLFGDDALEYRLRDSGASVAVVDGEAAAKLARIRDRLPDLRHVVGVGDVGALLPGAHPAGDLTERASDVFSAAATRPHDPALIAYTSGTTGPPKGAVLPHSSLIGHLPGFVLFNNLAPQPGDILWSPADWAWIGGLFTRTSMLQVMAEDYIRTARSKGLAPPRIVLAHVLRNAALPIVTTVGLAFGYTLTGSFIVEIIFNIPGMARIGVEGILQRDYTVIQAVVLIYTSLFILVNLCVDLSYAFFNPRVRY